MSSIPGLFVLGGELLRTGANRLGASALMQGLADGYFIAPSTVTAWLADIPVRRSARIIPPAATPWRAPAPASMTCSTTAATHRWMSSTATWGRR